MQKCGYGANADEFVMDQIVLAINSDATRQKLWVEDDLTLEKAKKICRAAERASKQIFELNNDPNASSSASVNVIGNDKLFDCARCGSKHGYRSCPAYNKKCNSCGNKGHFKSMCRQNLKKEHAKEKRYKTKNHKQNKKVYMVSASSSDSSDRDTNSDGSSADYQFVGSIETKRVNAIENNKWQATLAIGSKKLNLKLDTGAECNVLSEKNSRKVKS